MMSGKVFPPAPAADPGARWLRRLAWVCAALVLAIILLSATLRLAKSGIGCAPWPQCYGAAQAGAVAQAPDALAPVRAAHRVLAVAALGEKPYLTSWRAMVA